MEKFIQLKEDNIIRIGIRDSSGKDTGEHLEFDLENIDLPLNYQKCEEMHRKNLSDLKSQFIIIDRKQDHKGKKLLSANEESKIKAVKDFYKKEMEALDLFLGIGGTKKILNGRQPYYSMYDDINEILKPVLPILGKGFKKIEEKIKFKYSKAKNNNDSDILE